MFYYEEGGRSPVRDGPVYGSNKPWEERGGDITSLQGHKKKYIRLQYVVTK